ncbi:universal stress protein [Streptomyces sp. NPDC097704]|uniref:universal stress protein n=1 Tax=Streptomyces sp. NPDC097704 TaxID=3157101 RepID=UPI00332082E5
MRTITVGLDGSKESLAAAEWAAREAGLLHLPLRLVQIWEPVTAPMAEAPLPGAETRQHWAERILRVAAEGLRRRHPGVEVTTEQLTGERGEALAHAARDAELLVLGSRDLGGIGGFLVGSVGLSTLAHAERPVVLVHAGEQAVDEHEKDGAGAPSTATPFRPVVLGLDVADPDDALIEFAFAAAARRNAPLRVVHGINPPPYYYAYGMALEPALEQALHERDATLLTEELSAVREKFPEVEVVEDSGFGSPALRLIDASRDASLVVVGRRMRRRTLGTHIGPVTHAVLHHATAPVAVVAHD